MSLNLFIWWEMKESHPYLSSSRPLPRPFPYTIRWGERQERVKEEGKERKRKIGRGYVKRKGEREAGKEEANGG